MMVVKMEESDECIDLLFKKTNLIKHLLIKNKKIKVKVKVCAVVFLFLCDPV
jgi:hypothetical protein